MLKFEREQELHITFHGYFWRTAQASVNFSALSYIAYKALTYLSYIAYKQLLIVP